MEFEKNPKMPRLYRNVCITEKIDGTHGAIFIREDNSGEPPYVMAVGSRNRFITPGKGNDNFGFAGWVEEWAEPLAELLGPGIHRGEWWGKGIQRGYGLDCKIFSLFATHRWTNSFVERVQGLEVVPVLYQGPLTKDVVDFQLEHLSLRGSYAAPGFMEPEGIVMYHEAAKQLFKITLDGDGHKRQRIDTDMPGTDESVTP